MQLILNTDIDIGIQKKMSTLQQESLEEKFSNNSLIEKIVSDIDNITNENNDCMNNQNETEICKENGNALVIGDHEKAIESEAIAESSLCTDVKESIDEKNKFCDVDKENGETVIKECTSEDNNKLSQASINEIEDEESSKVNINESENNNENPVIENKQINDVMEECECGDNINKYETNHQTTDNNTISVATLLDNEVSKETSELEIVDNIDKNKVKDENFIEYEKQQDTKIEESKIDNFHISEKGVSETEENKNDSVEEFKEIVENYQTETGVEINKEETEVESSNDCHTLSEQNDKNSVNIDDQIDNKTEELIDNTTRDMRSDINKDNNIISLEALHEDKHDDDEKVKKNEVSNMEVDEELLTVINNETCEDNPILQENVDNPILQENVDSPILQENVDSPILQENVDSPILQENVDDRLINERQDMTNNIESDEIIDIADEKDEDFSSIEDENKSQILNKLEINNIEKHDISTKCKDNEITVAHQGIIYNLSEQLEIFATDVKTSTEEPSSSDKKVDEKKTFTHISKLSNTLDILSDDEDLPNLIQEPETDIKYNVTIDKQCINIIEDDDDIMLIDEESNTKDIENKTENLNNPVMDFQKTEDCITEYKIEVHDQNKATEMSKNLKDDSEPDSIVENEVKIDTSEPKLEDNLSENINQIKPLLSINFLKTCKKNLADMNRDELEEFCILKIVESVVDRSNLSEIKSQLKSMAQNIDEYKKKASALLKQNRDMQVVLKSVQEEQKKRSNASITPLKIMRSVGMQVLMTEGKPGARRKPLQAPGGTGGTSTISRPGKNPAARPTRVTSAGSTSIPVPRLVPAVNNNLNSMKSPSAGTNPPVKPLAVNPIPNGLTNLAPAQKPEKRPHARTQSSGFTVDLTDDEPPAKLIQRNVNPPVRLVNPQNLLAPHRQPFGASINSPRKVYIPISGSQNQSIRPGQTIMLKAITPQGPRQRCPVNVVAKANPSPNLVRMQRIASRHPAPLPDTLKQYQPPNWKLLPPAPSLKLSKVDNGIVISWSVPKFQHENHEEIASYQLYAYQESNSPPSTELWKKIGDVKALALPMACTLTQFMAGYKYYFAVRAVDVRSRIGPFSLPSSIILLNKL